MRKTAFTELCEELTLALPPQNMHMRQSVPVQKQVVITIWKLPILDCYRSVANQFGVGKSTVCAVVTETCDSVIVVVRP